MGRPKLLDREQILERALDVFWTRGYREASVRDLASEMGVNVATIYSEFGDKEGLYAAALSKYESEKVPLFIGALERPGADADTIIAVLRAFASFSESDGAPGCLITNSAVERAPDAARSQAALARYAERLSSAYARALEASPSATPPTGATPTATELANALTATTLGLFVLIRARATPGMLHHAVDVAVASLPTTARPRPPASDGRPSQRTEDGT